MWPKLIAQLFDLLPHINRLVPLAEKFFSSRAATDPVPDPAYLALTERVHGDLGQITQSHSDLSLQLKHHAAKLEAVAEQTHLTQLAMEQREHRVESLVQQVATLTTWVRTTTAISLLLLTALLIIALRVHR